MEEVFRRLFEACEVRSLPKEKQQKYQSNMTTKRDYENILYTAELRGEKRGVKKGIEEGIEIGVEKGIEKGIEKEARRIASEMKEEGVSEAIICRLSKLSPEEVRML